MKFAIVEDEKIFVEELKKTLKIWAEGKDDFSINAYYTGEEIIKYYIEEHTEFDIIFMDIKLGGMDGIQTAKQLRKNSYEGEIVFTTHHTDFEFTHQGYDVSALAYFSKPVTVANIEYCVKRLNKNNKYTYIYNGKQICVSYKEILYFECERNYINIVTIDSGFNPPRFRSSIEKVLYQLPQNFVQCYRSYIVNVENIFIIEGKDIHMKNQTKLAVPISDAYLDNLLSVFKKL